MCSYLLLISKSTISDYCAFSANSFIKSRGPNATSIHRIRAGSLHILAMHNLLDISGKAIEQPMHDPEGRLMLFNGEIYNPKDKNIPDTKLLFEELRKGSITDFLRKSSGEYSITTLDTKANKLTLFTDLIGTKPLFYGWRSGTIGIASYSRSLEEIGLTNIFEGSPNSITAFDLKNIEEPSCAKSTLHELILRQDCDNLKSWNQGFLRSVEERGSHFNSKIFVPLSAGYDSGAICCALNQLKVPYVSVTVGDSENKQILEQRVRRNAEGSCIQHHWLPAISEKDYTLWSNYLNTKLGTICYDHLDRPGKKPTNLHEDAGAIGLAILCQKMSELGLNTMLSGSGADEIVSDYGHAGIKLYEHSEFGGMFPDDLEKGFFPWRKFYGDSQRSYLRKDEMVSGLFGIEGRYPFLDKNLVQCFLRLSPNLKNRRYKNCIANFLEIHDYPFEPGIKAGFFPIKTRFSLVEKIGRKLKYLYKNT